MIARTEGATGTDAITGVAVEKLARHEFAEIASRQEALQTIFPSFLDIFYHPIFRPFSEKPTFSTATGFVNIYPVGTSCPLCRT
jgi:hypothetical protein